MRYFSEISCIHSWDFGTLVPYISDFIVCLSVCSLPHLLTEIRLILTISNSRWAIFLKFSGDTPGGTKRIIVCKNAKYIITS